jgi:hypothetical protein
LLGSDLINRKNFHLLGTSVGEAKQFEPIPAKVDQQRRITDKPAGGG